MATRRTVAALLGVLIAAGAAPAGAQIDDGTLLLARTVGRVELYTARDYGTNQRRLGDAGRILTAPGWSPDGSNERKLTRAGSETMPSWSEDGGRIAFATARDPDRLGRRSAYAMNADGSCESRVATGVVWRNAWRPGPAARRSPLACADLGLTLRVTRRVIGRRQQARFVVRVRNDGNRPATNVVVRFAPGRRAQVKLGPLAVGAVRTVEFVVRPRRPGTLVARTSVRANELDRNRSDNAAVVTIRRR